MRTKWIVSDLTGCWQWQLRTDRDGYGRLAADGRTGVLAHRWAWEQVNGPIPDGLTVDHTCRNRACVNPAHLRLLPHEQNAAITVQSLKTHCANGHEFTPENTYPRRRNGKRQCRACNRAAVARYKQRKTA